MIFEFGKTKRWDETMLSCQTATFGLSSFDWVYDPSERCPRNEVESITFIFYLWLGAYMAHSWYIRFWLQHAEEDT